MTSHEYKELKTGAHGHKRGFTPGPQWPDGKIPFVVDSSLGRTVNFGTKNKLLFGVPHCTYRLWTFQ